MRILVIGNGGREHAIAWKISQSSEVDKLYVAPGNGGTAAIAENVAISATDIEGLVRFSVDQRIDLVIVGPEAPLAEGIVDRLEDKRIPVFGPRKNAAEIESSKVFSKMLMQKYQIPCAKSASFSSYQEASEYIKRHKVPIVIKADGLAAGKGVVVASNIEEALQALSDFMEKEKLGKAGKHVVIEEYLTGREMSAFVVTDGINILPLVPACDYKTVFDENQGPNTGGMGSYSPPFFFNQLLGDRVQKTIMVPTVQALASEGRTYKGVLYGGLMVQDNSPQVLEFNARFGDPETEVILPRMKTDLVKIMMATVENKLNTISNVEWHEEACVGVVMASGGYPGNYKTGFPIEGLEKVDKDALVFHAGTRIDKDGRIVTSGGRVLIVVAMGKSVSEARMKAYRNVKLISFEGCHYRTDIGLV